VGRDITYVRLQEEFVFLAVILDAYSRRVLVAAGEGATLAGQWEPHRECSVAASGCGGIVWSE
jgi:hypothetical protein